MESRKEFKELLRRQVSELKALMQEVADRPPKLSVEAVRRAADRLFYMGGDRVESILEGIRKALEDLDQAVESVGGSESRWGRRIMSLVRRLDGFQVVQARELRTVDEDFVRPSSLRFVTSLPRFQEKLVEDLMEDLYDLADEMEGGGE